MIESATSAMKTVRVIEIMDAKKGAPCTATRCILISGDATAVIAIVATTQRREAMKEYPARSCAMMKSASRSDTPFVEPEVPPKAAL
jgi:hypothetical protein